MLTVPAEEAQELKTMRSHVKTIGRPRCKGLKPLLVGGRGRALHCTVHGPKQTGLCSHVPVLGKSKRTGVETRHVPVLAS